VRERKKEWAKREPEEKKRKEKRKWGAGGI